MAFQPPSWGGESTNKDYEFFMQGSSAIARPVSLVGHALTSPNQNLSDPVTKQTVKKINGQLVDREIVVRPAQQLSVTFTILFGNALETPALVRARRGASVKTTFYAVRLCAEEKYGHAYIFPGGLMNPPIWVNDPISIGDTGLADWQTDIRCDEFLTLFEVFGYIQKSTGSDPLYALSFFSEDCAANQSATLYNDMIAVGGQGATNDIVILLSNDRFATNSAPSSAPAPTGSIGTSVWTRGDVVLVGFADVASGGAGTVGGTLFSVDGGDNFTPDNDISVPIFRVERFNTQYLAVGGSTAGGAYVGISEDGVNWTAVTDTDLPTDSHVTDLAVDIEEGVAYITCADATFYRIEPAGDSVNVVPITNLPGAPTSLTAVDVKASDHLAVAGSSAYYAETVDGGTTWTQPTLPTSSDVSSLSGNAHRSVAAAATGVFVRDVLSDFEYSALELSAGAAITGNVTDVAELPNDELQTDNLNYFAFCTDQEEIFSIKSDSPFA